jgi:hypothetical protein
MSALNLCASIVLLIVMLAAAFSKVRSAAVFDEFALSLMQFGVRERRLRRPAALTVILLEFLAVACLLMPIDSRLIRFGPTMVLLVGFSLAVLVASRRTTQLACHCFGSASTTPVSLHLSTNVALLVLASAAVISPAGAVSSDGSRVLAIGLGVIAAVTVLALPPVLVTLAPELTGTSATR